MMEYRTLIIPQPRLRSAPRPGLAFDCRDEAALAARLAEAAASERERIEKRDGRPDTRVRPVCHKRPPGASRAGILRACRDRPMTQRELVEVSGLAKSTVRDMLYQMVRSGELRLLPHPGRRDQGLYEAAT